MIQVPTPSGIYGYIDKVTVWFETPLPRKALRFLKSTMRSGWVARPHRTGVVQQRFATAVQLNQPNKEALTYLGERDSQWINYVEIALDWIFDDEQQKDKAYDLICHHHVQRWHGKQQVRFKNGTRYSAQRRAHNTLAIYADKPCRITGEVDCVHLDWRVRGQKTVERMGISTCQS